jgi:hypothetical protein
MSRLYVGFAIGILTLLGFLQFPGHTFLQSDTQIYVPILERFWDPSVLNKDLVAIKPHVAFTIYDEAALLLRRLTGMDFFFVLTGQQLLFRALGTLGIYLIATAAGLRSIYALVVAAIHALGATIVGPAVLTVEYEPVPRGFTVPLIFLAVGLCGHGRMMAAAFIGAVATMYHPPTVYPFALVFLFVAVRSRRWAALCVFLSGSVLLLVSSRLQAGMIETQLFLSQVPPAVESLQRIRASYNWVGHWAGRLFWHYVLLTVALALAWLRTHRHLRDELKPFLLGMPAIGLLSLPASYILLDRWKWALIPQLQPARALLFLVATAVLLGAIAGVYAALSGLWFESAGWFLFVLTIPAQPRYLELLFPDLSDAVMRNRFLVVATLAILLTAALWLWSRSPLWSQIALTVWMALPFVAIPHIGRTSNYAVLHSPELDRLSMWARTATSKDAVFLFGDAGQSLVPGVFRARALRALYVDWKAGGQVNFVQSFATDWWNRWQDVMAGAFHPARLERFKQVGIEYVVLGTRNRLPERRPVYENPAFVVYRMD